MELPETSRIVVIMGGLSEEREVSLRSGQAVLDALVREGYANAQPYVVDDETLPDFPGNVDVAFIAMHGRFGEDGVLQAMLEKRGVAYTGSGPGASRLCMDKVRTKEVFRIADVPAPAACFVDRNTDLEEIERRAVARVGFPAVVKPVGQGSSVGVTIVNNGIELLLGATAAFAFTDDVIIEEYVEGREITVGILDGKALPLIEIKPGRAFFDYSAKYSDRKTNYKVKPRFRKAVTERVKELAERAFESCGCRHFARVDLKLNKKFEPYFLEINTIPGLTKRSLFPMAAKAAGLSFGQLCASLCELAAGGEPRAEVA
ncbi:MAG: D-alanine--D-alanine ligase family protein [Planctomycetota bacterium]|jgi:D-alanine--D-alanine ligase